MAAGPDPGALLASTVADLNMRFGPGGWEEGRINEAEGNLATNVGFAENEIGRQEPIAYRGIANKAAKGGILTSGISQTRNANAKGAFEGRRAQNQAKLQQGNAGFKRQREGLSLKRTEGIHNAEGRFANESNAQQANNPTVPPFVTPPPAQGVYGGTVNTKGVVNPRPVIKNQPFVVKVGGKNRGRWGPRGEWIRE